MVKFAHLADCHLGGWKIPEMSHLNSKTFEVTIDSCINQKVDFVLIAGDFFDTAMPPIDVLKIAATKLRQLKEHNIPCYLIPGSHDYSASGKTFLDVLHNAGLCINVGSKDELEVHDEENVLVAGIAGLKTQRDQEIIRKIKTPSLEQYKDKLKVIMLHTTIDENSGGGLIESLDTDDMPAGFDYYAMGHIHQPFNQKINGKLIVFPGPLFPNNFSEVEELGSGGFVIATYKNGKISVERQEIKLKDTLLIEADASGQTPEMVTSYILGLIKRENIDGKIVLLRVSGTLSKGKTSDIDFTLIGQEAEKLGRYVLLKNISSLESHEYKVKVKVRSDNVEEIEKEIMEEQKVVENEFGDIFQSLVKCLDLEKYEGETATTFENRVLDEAYKYVDLDALK